MCFSAQAITQSAVALMVAAEWAAQPVNKGAMRLPASRLSS
jgi:hypothetical protein